VLKAAWAAGPWVIAEFDLRGAAKQRGDDERPYFGRVDDRAARDETFRVRVNQPLRMGGIEGD
jgi:hypothetical protein